MCNEHNVQYEPDFAAVRAVRKDTVCKLQNVYSVYTVEASHKGTINAHKTLVAESSAVLR